jgi:hypothetical protein
MPREPTGSRFPSQRPIEEYLPRRFNPLSGGRLQRVNARVAFRALLPECWENRDHSARSAWGCVVASPSLCKRSIRSAPRNAMGRPDALCAAPNTSSCQRMSR